MNRSLLQLGVLPSLLGGSGVQELLEEVDKELALGHRIVTAAEHDRWKEAHEEIHVDVKCSAEEIVVMLTGVIPHEIFQLKDPKCRLSPIDRNTQSIQIRPPTACGSALEINSTHLVVLNEIIQPIATSIAPHVFSGNVGCVFGEQELRASLYYDSPAIPMLNDVNSGNSWTSVKTYGGVGANLIWARMDLYEDEDFGEKFLSPPVMKTSEKLHVGIELLRSPEEESYLYVDSCWAVPNDYSDLRLELVTDGCMHHGLKKEGIEFEVINNGMDERVFFTVPVFKFVGSDHVYLQCQVRACLRHSCQPSCAMPDQGRLMPDFDLANKSYDEIIYEEEPEYEIGDHAMLKSVRTVEKMHEMPQFSKLSSISIRIKEEVKPAQGPFDGKLDPISLLLLTVLATSVALLIGIICILFHRRKRLHKQMHVHA